MKILGLSCYYHDGAAVLIVDGRLLAAAEEERFTRIKHDSSFPESSVKFCLEEARIKSSDLDYVVFYEKPFKKFERIVLATLATAPAGFNSFYNSTLTWLKDKLWIKETIAKKVNVPYSKILFSEHHLSHASSTFFSSPFASAAILSVDGVGEWTTTAWGRGRENKIFLDYELRFPHSLGLFYSTFTQFLGFEINEGEFKVMGLAPYGKPTYVGKIKKMIRQSKDGSFSLDMNYFSFHHSLNKSYSKRFIGLLGVQPNKSPEIVSQPYADIAASAQKILEESLVNITKNIYKKTHEENLCLAGGVALNGVANWKIYKEAGFKNIFIQPAAGDSGGALGSALYVYNSILDNKRSFWRSPYLGKSYSKLEIESILQEKNIPFKKLSWPKLTKLLARKLQKGKVIGWFQGRFEWGPRALGARSILADPRSSKMKDLVNAKIKFREGFRPFAPVVAHEKARDYFELEANDINQQPLEYMLFVVPVKKESRKVLGAVTHVDGTARLQIIKKQTNKIYYNLISDFGKLTGVYVLLNTSFNLKGEPIVASPQDALNTFERSGLDILVLENYLILKKDLG